MNFLKRLSRGLQGVSVWLESLTHEWRKATLCVRGEMIGSACGIDPGRRSVVMFPFLFRMSGSSTLCPRLQSKYPCMCDTLDRLCSDFRCDQQGDFIPRNVCVRNQSSIVHTDGSPSSLTSSARVVWPYKLKFPRSKLGIITPGEWAEFLKVLQRIICLVPVT